MKSLEESKSLMARHGLPAGERRTYSKCRTCGNVMVREYIPHGIGFGRSFDPCLCCVTKNDQAGYDVLEEADGPIEAASK